jgi:Zn-dependent protease with chaperone function
MNALLLDALPFALLGGALFALLLAAAIAAVEHVLLERLAPVAPPQRERLLLALLLAPLFGGVGYAVLTAASALLTREGGLLTEVCANHGGSIWHACVWHPPTDSIDGFAWMLLALLCITMLLLCAGAVLSIWRSRRAVDALLRLSHPEHGARILDSAQPLALTAGFRGQVLLSRALLDGLDAKQLRIVLAHELSHVAHRDVLRRWLASRLSRLHLPGTRRRLRAALDLAVEQRCDRAAADVVGDPLAVAETIVAVERLFAGHPAPPGLALAAHFAHGMVDARVSALLSPPSTRARGLGAALIGAMVTVVVAANGSLHHLTEFLLTRFPG